MLWEAAQRNIDSLTNHERTGYNVFECCIDFYLTEAWLDLTRKSDRRGDTYEICESWDEPEAKLAEIIKRIVPNCENPESVAKRIRATYIACKEMFNGENDPENDQITMSRIKRTHAMVVGLDPSTTTNFRTTACANDQGVRYVSPGQIPSKLEDLLTFLRTQIGVVRNFKDRLMLSVLFLERFMFIHPFQEGNGRTARLLFSVLMRPFCAPVPLSLFWRDKEIRNLYIESIHANAGGPPICLAYYVLKCLVTNSRRLLDAISLLNTNQPEEQDATEFEELVESNISEDTDIQSNRGSPTLPVPEEYLERLCCEESKPRSKCRPCRCGIWYCIECREDGADTLLSCEKCGTDLCEECNDRGTCTFHEYTVCGEHYREVKNEHWGSPIGRCEDCFHCYKCGKKDDIVGMCEECEEVYCSEHEPFWDDPFCEKCIFSKVGTPCYGCNHAFKPGEVHMTECVKCIKEYCSNCIGKRMQECQADGSHWMCIGCAWSYDDGASRGEYYCRPCIESKLSCSNNQCEESAIYDVESAMKPGEIKLDDMKCLECQKLFCVGCLTTCENCGEKFCDAHIQRGDPPLCIIECSPRNLYEQGVREDES